MCFCGRTARTFARCRPSHAVAAQARSFADLANARPGGAARAPETSSFPSVGVPQGFVSGARGHRLMPLAIVVCATGHLADQSGRGACALQTK